MIKNQRICRYLIQKKVPFVLSLLISGCFNIGFDAMLGFASVLPLGDKTVPDRAWAQNLFPRPKSDMAVPTMPSIESSVDLSVIIPAYNAERFVKNCVDSVLKQKTSRKIEIIVVNDNSTDGTMAILSEISGIKVIDFKQGGSAAKARNEGIIHSVGKYIMFLDSDDVLTENAIDILLDCAEKNNADIVQGGWQYISEDDEPGTKQIYQDEKYIDKKRISCFDLPGMPWGKIYRRELFETIRFPSYFTSFEDTIVHFALFRKAEIICSVSPIVYLWRKNSQGITANSQNTTRAIQSYWIVEEMLSLNDIWMLEKDKEFYLCLISQLTNYCYVNVRNTDDNYKSSIFALCCDLYEKNSCVSKEKELPYYIRIGAKALREKNYSLWRLHGEISRLLR